MGPPAVDEVRARLVDGLAAALPTVAIPQPRAGPVVVTLPLLRRVRDGRGTASADEPFVWRSRFVERSLGVAIVDACVRGGYRAPAEAAGPVLAHALGEWRRTGWRTFHWEPWVAGLGAGGRAAILAAAVTWATALWSSLDWGGFARPPRIGGPSDRWTSRSRSARGVRLTGRADLTVDLGSDEDPPLAIVSVLRGSPSIGWTEELAYPALLSALCRPWRPAPVRSVGIWPDAGRSESLEVDERALTSAVDLVLSVVPRLLAPDESADASGRPRPLVGVTS